VDDIYRINEAKAELREAYEASDVDRLMAVFSSAGFTDMSEGGPSKYGAEARSRFRHEASKLLAEYSVMLTPIIIKIVVLGEVAYDYGWHEFTLTPRTGENRLESDSVISSCGIKTQMEIGESHCI
jgi:hypothetical protein